MVKQIKTDTDKFTKFKKKAGNDLDLAKKAVNDKDKMVYKLKQDLKKTDQLAQMKITEIKALKKKAEE